MKFIFIILTNCPTNTAILQSVSIYLRATYILKLYSYSYAPQQHVSMSSRDGDTAGLDTTIQSEGSQARRCPFCDRTGDDEREIYRHLMKTHRKSELSRGLLALVRPDQSTAQSDNDPEMLSGDTLIQR
jgi:hypothetical protein